MTINVIARRVYFPTKQSCLLGMGIASRRTLAMTENRKMVMNNNVIVRKAYFSTKQPCPLGDEDCLAKNARND